MAMPDRRSASATEDQNALGWLSYSSRLTQAASPGSDAAHDAKAIVLPAPTGPVRTVNGHHRVPWVISWVIRGLRTAQSGTFGAVIFEARTGSLADTAEDRKSTRLNSS